MNEFWKWLLNFFTEHWQDMALGAGILFNCLRTPKTAEEKRVKKLEKAQAKSAKLEKKLHSAYETQAKLEGETKV